MHTYEHVYLFYIYLCPWIAIDVHVSAAMCGALLPRRRLFHERRREDLIYEHRSAVCATITQADGGRRWAKVAASGQENERKRLAASVVDRDLGRTCEDLSLSLSFVQKNSKSFSIVITLHLIKRPTNSA